MEYKTEETGYVVISPGTAGVAQKISSIRPGEETSELVFLSMNNVMSCGHNQY